VAVQESKESVACVKEMHQEYQATKHTGSQDTGSVNRNDTINDLQLVFKNLDLGNQVHDLLVVISEIVRGHQWHIHQ
jgi:hypothetical protein